MAPPGRQPPALLPAAAAVGPATLLAAAAGAGGSIAATVGVSVQLISPDGSCTLLTPPPDSAGKPLACLAAGGAFVAAGERGSKPGLYVWRLAPAAGEGAEIGRALHNFGIAALTFSPSGRLLASHGAEKDWQLAVWSPATGRLLGKAREKGQQYDVLAMPSEDRICGINRTMLAVWSLERSATTDGSLKLTCASRYTLPTVPAPTRFVGLWGLAGGARANLRLLACTDSGRLMRLRPGGSLVDTEVNMGDARVLAVAASQAHIAAACSDGIVRLFSAATLQPAAALERPAHLAQGSSAVALSFAADGAQLVVSYRSGSGGSLLATWNISNMQQPALLDATLRACHSEGITDAISIPTNNSGALVASCSLDGSLQLWGVGTGGAIASTACLDLRAALNSTTTKPLCLAASEDGRLLAVGDAAGCVHLFSLADPCDPAKLSTTHVCDADTTALAFGPCPADGSVPLLAVGSKRGGLRLLQLGGSAEWHRRASCSPSGARDASSAALASIADHKGAVTGAAFFSRPGSSGLRLTTCGADGRQLTYSWDAEAKQLRPAAQAAVPRASFAGLAPVLAGQTVVAATKGGRLSWEDAAGQEAVVQVLDKRQGELAAFAVDPTLSLVAVATNLNTLLLHRLAMHGNKPTTSAAGSCKAHVAGTAIAKLLILPDSGCVLTAGEDGSVCTHHLPATIAATLLSRRPAHSAAAQQQAAPAQSVEAPAPTCSGGSSGLSSVVQPRALINDLPSPAAEPATAPPAPVALEGSGRLTTVMAPPATLPTHQPQAEPAVEAPAACLRRAVSLPPSPARASVLASMPGLEEQFAELQSTMNRSFTTQRRAAQVPAAMRPPSAPPAAVPAASPQPASPAVAAAGASPSLNWFASPLAQSETLSAISMGTLGQSPDVFAGLESPAVPALSSAAAPTAQPERSLAPPASVGSTSKGASISAKLSRLVRRPWSRSPAAASSSTKSADGAAVSVGAALDAVDANRTAALLRMSATEGQEAGAGGPPSAAFFSTNGAASATVDLAAALAPQPGSTSVNGPRRQRRGWGPVPNSAEQPRRSLSAMGTSCPSSIAASIGAEEAPRPHSVQGFEQQQQISPDAFSVNQDACSAQGTPPGQAEAASAGSARSRRLSFSFGGGPRRTVARSAAKDEETPTMGVKPAACPQPAPAFDPASYASPGLPPVAQQPAAADSTPRLFGFGKKPAAEVPAPAAAASAAPPASASAPAAAPAAPSIASGEPPAQDAPAAQQPEPALAAPAPTAPASGAAPVAPVVFKGRPTIPKLNLSSVGQHLATGVGAAATSSSAPHAASGTASKRRRQVPAADAPEGLSLSSDFSEGSEHGNSPVRTAGAAGAAAQQAALPESKKARPGMSPPRIVLNCSLFEPGSELRGKPEVKLSMGSSGSRRRRSSGAYWPVASGGGTALSFEPSIAEEDEAEAAQEERSPPAGTEAGADDPFSRPAAHDPLLEEEQEGSTAARPAAGLLPTACVPASAFCTGAAELPTSGCCSPEPASAPASGRAASGASPFGAVPSVGLAMELLQRGALMLSCLGQPLSERTCGDLAEIATSLSRMAGLDAPEPAAAPATAPTSCDRENMRSNSNGAAGVNQAWPAGFDAAAFKAEILRELRQELHMGQQ